jgi:hypothetical protein
MTADANPIGRRNFLLAADAMESLGQYVHLEPADELVGCRASSSADCPRYRHRRIYGEGASHQPDEKDEGALAPGAQPNGGYAKGHLEQ